MRRATRIPRNSCAKCMQPCTFTPPQHSKIGSTSEERRLLERSADQIRRHVVNEEGAITGAFFRRSPLLQGNSPLDRVLSKVLPFQFTAIYSDVFAAVTPTGFPQFSFFEGEQSFPYLEFDVVFSLLAKLGMTAIIFDHSEDGTRQFLDFRSHRNFHEFVRSKDNLLYLLDDHPARHAVHAARLQQVPMKLDHVCRVGKGARAPVVRVTCKLDCARRAHAVGCQWWARRAKRAFAHPTNSLRPERAVDLSAHLRALQILPVEAGENDPFVAAAELYRASEHLCRDLPAAQARRQTMTNAHSWIGKYLIMTATDNEDQALRTEFAARGFTRPIVQNADRLSYVEYFRSDIGRVYHVRTSAGSGGASGAFIMGKNAIELLKPEYVISVGVCFGLREDKQRIGDIIISEHVHDYEKFRVSPTRPEDRGATREAAPVLLSRARANLAIWLGATVHVGTVVSGEKLVDDREFRDFLRHLNPPPIAGEMEAWGLSAVCHETRKQFIMVKGICDWGMNKKSDQQDVAVANACKFAFDALIVA